MNNEIEKYNTAQTEEAQAICNVLMEEIIKCLLESKSKIYHGSPVWFIDDNPIVGYSKLKNYVQLLFWSGQSFEEEGLIAVGKFKAAEAGYKQIEEIDRVQLTKWLKKSIEIQWDYKNIVKRNGDLVRLK